MLNDELMNVKIELRELQEKVGEGSIRSEDAKARLQELQAQKRSIEQKIAHASAPVMDDAIRGDLDYNEIRSAMIEKRTVVLNGTGAHNQVNELLKEMERRTSFLSKIRYFRGNNAVVSIPLLSPTIAVPDPHVEGATNIPVDNQAALANRVLKPKAFISTLPVSAETLALGSVDFERRLPEIFGNAFAQGFARQVMTGDGTGNNFLGLFPGANDNTMDCGAAGVPRINDFVGLALQLRDHTDNGVIVTNHQTYQGIMADPATGVAEKYKDVLIRDRTIEGVPVLITGFAPSSIVSGSTVAVAGDLYNYGMAISGEIRISPIPQVGTAVTYFMATVFANGAPSVPRNFIGLRTL